MKSLIIITVPNRMADHELIVSIQDKIVSYFGTRNSVADKNYPQVEIFCDIMDDDIIELKKGISEEIKLTGILGMENSDRVREHFIVLN
jgi:hypothetical protein